MGWSVSLTVNNDTDYNLNIVNNDAGLITTVAPHSSFSWTTEDPNNTNSFRFWKVANVWYMQGSVSFGPEAGVYMDRGWMADNDQTLVLTADVNGTAYTQTANGGATVLPWNAFEQGGTITMDFKAA